MSKLISTAMRGNQTLLQTAAARTIPRPFESPRVSDNARFLDHPAPTEDDMISKLTKRNGELVSNHRL